MKEKTNSSKKCTFSDCRKKLSAKVKDFSNFCSKHKKLLIKLFCICTVLAIAAALTFTVIIPRYNYNAAQDFISQGKYDKAYEKLISSGNYKDTKEIKKNFLWVPGETASTYSNISGTYTTSNEYDENGNLIMQITTNPDHDQSIVENTYDGNGNCIKRVMTDPFETKTVEMTYAYENDLVVQMTIVSSPENIVTSKYEYDKNGNCIKSTTILPGNKENIEEVKYNKDNNPAEKVVKTASGYEETTLYTYDENGNCTKEVTKAGSESKKVTENTYDKNDNLVRRKTTDFDGNTDTIKYTLDKYGNCIKSVSKDSNGVKITNQYNDYKVYYKG